MTERENRSREDMTRELMETTTMTIEDATFAVDHWLGLNEGDVKTGSPKLRKELGLDVDPRDAVAADEERARRTK